jgi:uncharacterized protein YkwD
MFGPKSKKMMKIMAKFLLATLLCSSPAMAQQSSQEQQLVRELNQSRAEAGLPPLKADERLTQAAREHSQKMADTNTLGHVLPGEAGVAQRLAATGLHFNRSGENVGYNTDFNGLHSGFMKSPPHRENILNRDYTLVGIGVVLGDEDVYWATQDFAQAIVDRTADEVEDLVAERVKSLRSSIQRVGVSSLHELACSMGKAGKVDPRKVLALPGVHYAVTYNNSRPEELPDSAKNAARTKSVTKFAVGACEASGKTNPGGTYYVVMAFY